MHEVMYLTNNSIYITASYPKTVVVEGRYLTFLFSSKVLRALTPSGHNDPVCWDVDNCDKKTRNIFFTSLLHEIELVNRMSDD